METSTNLSIIEVILTALGLLLVNGAAVLTAWNRIIISDAKQEVRIRSIEREYEEIRQNLNENTTNDRRDYEKLVEKIDSLRSHIDRLYRKDHHE
jgi:hypothetical protein